MGKTNWGKVQEHLQNEVIKPRAYDDFLLELMRDLTQKNILDYGSGPAVLAKKYQSLGGLVKTFDNDPYITETCKKEIGKDKVYNALNEIPKNYFDIVTCNLVLCINKDEKIPAIMESIRDVLVDGGKSFLGFCNPLILNVPETRLDFRPSQEEPYHINHFYQKTKKEGNYDVVDENHRPISWYEKMFHDAGLIVLDRHFTPEYEFNGKKGIHDFIIFEVKK
ncbi:class I SAM-dependent methyltransferase [Desulfosarcina sp.]|nr:class I SAM-dependent methyltransferase [Desulfosarcina sp.]